MAIYNSETMKQKTLLDILAEDDGSVDAVLKAIEQLREELRQGGHRRLGESYA